MAPTSQNRDEREALTNEIAGLMGPLIRGLRGSLRTCAESLGLAQSDANALWVLAASGPLSTKDLAQRLDMDPANASTMLTRLEKRGLVAREASEQDRRKRVASLTDAGRDTRRALANCVGERQPSFSALSNAELATFRDLLRRAARPG